MSSTSDLFEQKVANDLKKIGVPAYRPAANTALADVAIKSNATPHGRVFMEVKMNHTDNLSNPRMFFNGVKWDTTYKTPVAKYAVDLLNASSQWKKFHAELKKYLNVKQIKLPTSKSGLKEVGAVPLHILKDFVENVRANRYIHIEENVNIGDLVTKHYLEGKAEPAFYLQAGDDFYLIGNKDPLNINKGRKQKVPVLKGMGDFKVRISTRSEFYEIQAEVKIKKMDPHVSPFSVLAESRKMNPFVIGS
jgi:hypothetical protein